MYKDYTEMHGQQNIKNITYWFEVIKVSSESINDLDFTIHIENPTR